MRQKGELANGLHLPQPMEVIIPPYIKIEHEAQILIDADPDFDHLTGDAWWNRFNHHRQAAAALANCAIDETGNIVWRDELPD